MVLAVLFKPTTLSNEKAPIKGFKMHQKLNVYTVIVLKCYYDQKIISFFSSDF